MLWLYNTGLNDNNSLNFYQVFIENNLVYSDKDSNYIYLFNSTSSTDSKLNLNLKNYKCDIIECEIKIIDNIISYDILSINTDKTNKNYVFMIKSNFIKPDNNQFKLPIFSYIYKSTSTKRLPNLIESNYNCVSTLNFKIYKLDNENKIQFVIETNLLTNLTRKYFVTTSLNLIQYYTKL